MLAWQILMKKFVEKLFFRAGMISLILEGGSRGNVKGQKQINVNVHASLTSKMHIYGLTVTRSRNECDIVKLDIQDLIDVCCLLATPDNARLMPQMVNFVKDVDLNFICRGGMLFLDSVEGPKVPCWRQQQMTVIAFALKDKFIAQYRYTLAWLLHAAEIILIS